MGAERGVEPGEIVPALRRPEHRVTRGHDEEVARAVGGKLEPPAAGVAVDDIGVRRPTLDDVFLALTGHTAEESEKATEQEQEEVAA